MARYTKPQPKVYQADDVWAAACAAQRINGAYLKATTEDGKVANRTLVLDLLADTSKITDADREQGEDVRRYYKSLTFKLISGDHLSEFDNTALKIAQTDMIFSNYDIAVITSLPSCSERGRQRDAINNRIKFEGGGFIGAVGSKVTVDLEVLKCNYSQNWGVYYITGMTANKEVVFFGFKNQRLVGEKIRVTGNVKAHRDDSTQLNRVKVL